MNMIQIHKVCNTTDHLPFILLVFFLTIGSNTSDLSTKEVFQFIPSLIDLPNLTSSVMANFGTSQRIPTPSTPSSIAESTYEPKGPHEKFYTDIKIYCPFNVPLTSEAAAVRIMRNLGNLGLYYTLFVWIILFITLIPRRKVSLIILVIMTYVITLYCLLLRAFPHSVFLHRVIDKRFVWSLLVFATVVMLVLTDAGTHLAVTIACAVPIVLVHALLWVRHRVYDIEDDSGTKELAPLAGHSDGGAEGTENV